MTEPMEWDVPEWSAGEEIAELPHIRERYGEVIEDIVQLHEHLVRAEREGPRSPVALRTLRWLASGAPIPRPLRLHDDTWCRLMREAHGRGHRLADVDDLCDADIADCAQSVLGAWRTTKGRPNTDHFAVRLVRSLLAAAPEGLDSASRNDLLAAGLQACRINAGAKNLERLLTLARKADRIAPLPEPFVFRTSVRQWVIEEIRGTP